MKQKIIYFSELGNTFNTKEEAIADDQRLPDIIDSHRKDLEQMKKGGEKHLMRQSIEDWENILAKYEGMWEAAKNTSLSDNVLIELMAAKAKELDILSDGFKGTDKAWLLCVGCRDTLYSAVLELKQFVAINQ